MPGSLLALLLGSLTTVVSASTWMTDAEIRDAFAGRTIDGIYATGLTFTEAYRADGGVAYEEPGRRLSGRWSVVAGSFCTIYDDAISGGCFRVQRMSGNCYEFHFVAKDEDEAALRPGRTAWTARGWRSGERNTCDGVPTV